MAFCNLTYTSPWPFSKIGELLFETQKLESRKLPPSDILLKKQEQIVHLVQNWDAETEKEILAENFYLDQSRDSQMAHAKEVFEKIGSIDSIGAMDAYNQLRGTFKIMGDRGIVEVFFTLSPEKDPKVQLIDLELMTERSEK